MGDEESSLQRKSLSETTDGESEGREEVWLLVFDINNRTNKRKQGLVESGGGSDGVV